MNFLHSTDKFKITPEIIESIILNLPKTIKKFKWKIDFGTEEKLNEFLKLEKERK
jgi:hypothetical protein